jgi:hypothetical protein
MNPGMNRSLITSWNDELFQCIWVKVELISRTVKFFDAGKLEQAHRA